MTSSSAQSERTDPAGNGGEGQPGGLSLPLLGMTGFMTALAVLTAVAAYLYFGRQSDLSTHYTAQSRMAAASIAQAVSGRIRGYVDVVEAVAADPHFARSVASGDDTAISAGAGALQALLPGVIGIRVVRPGVTEPDESLVPPLGYACIELASQTISGDGRAPVEMHRFDTDDRHFEIARPIVNGNATYGSLLVAIDAAPLTGWIAQLDAGAGRAELRQPANGENVLLARIGPSESGGTAVVATAPVPGTRWQVAHFPVAPDRAIEPVRFFAPFAVAAVALGAVFALLFSMAHGMLRQDMMRLVGFMEDLWLNRRGHSLTVRFVESRKAAAEMEMAMERLRKLRRQLVASRRAGQAKAGQAKKAVRRKDDD